MNVLSLFDGMSCGRIAIFLLGSLQKANDEITKMKIDCPSNAWFPCVGGEPVDNWRFKAANLYKSKNCKLLLR